MVSGIITITTDFGERDPYVAMMKGVILTINPDARIVDTIHQVPPGSILEGASIIKQTYQYFPSGTVHLAVIDPGVGGKRRPIAVLADNHLFVGPDNGLFWPVIETQENSEVIHLCDKMYWMREISPTFHGRDIFAPVASHLSKGIDPFLMGEKVDNPITLANPLPRENSSDLVGKIIRVDHFGNLITNITREHLNLFPESKGLEIRVGTLTLKKISTTYGDVSEGEPLALIGSSNLLEIAINRGNVAHDLGQEFKVGTKVTIEFH
ncbi:MAG: SAM-dependent chlorinase/fluorinase [Deltaproteobacteria bacterium]|nr:SAM-dependent chlorinase/fluorinase [Deltaproteobacteria bacterium]MBW2338822.1 SAM-dependent chlorinase/fluorinase [Deltaproteobacteria bacterium]